MDAIRAMQLHLPPYAVEILRLTIWLLLLSVIFVPVERIWGLNRQSILRRGVLTDLGYYFLNSLLPGLVLALPLADLAWGAHHLVPYPVQRTMAELPLWAHVAAVFVIGEIGFYWGHRWSHEIPLLWRFHAVHHSAEEIDWLVNTRAHPVDMIFTRLCGFVPIYLVGLAQPTGGAADLAPALLIVVGTVWGFFIHANLRWRFGWLEFLVATPFFHHWHHTNDDRRDRNYAAMLPVLDTVFGTLYRPKAEWPPRYGVDAPIAANLGGQLVNPLLSSA